MASSTGNIERVLIELRPRLQSANFFISFRRRFAEIESTTIDLASDRLTIGVKGEREKYELRVGDFFKLHTQTLSSLVIKNRYLCFRVNTNESDFGSELLQQGGRFLASGDLQSEDVPRLHCNIETGKRYRVLCSNCRGPLDAAEGTTLKRVLELPSEQMDSDEWFCHRHDHHHHGSEGAGQPSSQPVDDGYAPALEPQQYDLLYGTFYALLHRSVLQAVHVRHERFLYCKRCLQYLGSIRKNRPCVKLWYEFIRFQQMDDERLTVALFQMDNSLELFRLLVHKTVREFNFALPPMFKLMFEMRRPGLNGDVFYLLLQIMDSQLSVFRIDQKRIDAGGSGSCSDDVDDDRRSDGTTDGDGSKAKERDSHSRTGENHVTYSNGDDENGDDDDDDDDVFIETRCQRHNIHLERQRAMKLLYRYEKYEQQPLFTFWREDSNVVSVEISEPMFTAAIHYLDSNSSYVPECYRVNLGFTLSYLDIT